MTRKDGVDCGTEPHDPSAQVKRFDPERQNSVIGRRRRRCTRGNGDSRGGHDDLYQEHRGIGRAY